MTDSYYDAIRQMVKKDTMVERADRDKRMNALAYAATELEKMHRKALKASQRNLASQYIAYAETLKEMFQELYDRQQEDLTRGTNVQG